MRRIGTLRDQTAAKRFAHYLITLEIEASIDQGSGDQPAEIWIRDEIDVARAREALSEFESDPNSSKYDVEQKAIELQNRKVEKQRQKAALLKKNMRSLPAGRRAGGFGAGQIASASMRQQKIPVTIGIIAISVLVNLYTNFGVRRGNDVAGERSPGREIYEKLSFVDIREYDATNQTDPWVSIKRGELWRLITPMFLHGDVMHLAFNMLWIFSLGSILERLHGSAFLAGLVLATHMAGMLLQVSLPTAEWWPAELRGTPRAVGASGAVYGLLGFLWILPSFLPSYPVRLQSTTIVLMLGWFVACMTPLIPRVANGAHAGGLIAGVLAAAAASRLSGSRIGT